MSRRLGGALAALALVALAALGLWKAATPAPATIEGRVDAVAATLRCPTCQGLSVKDSPSKVAESMRGIVGEQLAAGRSPDEVRSWFVDRYGPWILLAPTPAGLGWTLWLLPALAVSAGGVVAAMAVRRRRDRAGATQDRDLDAVEEALSACAAGTLSVPETPAGERLESSLLLLSSIRADRATGLSSAHAEALAAARVADALALVPAPQPSGPREPVRAPVRPARVPVALRWAGVATAFLLAVSGLLAVTTAPRGEGQLITGTLPQREDNGLDGLYAAVAANPDDRRARLLLASGLLQSGDDARAREEIDTLLAAQPDDPDGLLLLGFLQARQRDPLAQATLRRYLDLAPPEHPGREVATSLLEGES